MVFANRISKFFPTDDLPELPAATESFATPPHEQLAANLKAMLGALGVEAKASKLQRFIREKLGWCPSVTTCSNYLKGMPIRTHNNEALASFTQAFGYLSPISILTAEHNGRHESSRRSSSACRNSATASANPGRPLSPVGSPRNRYEQLSGNPNCRAMFATSRRQSNCIRKNSSGATFRPSSAPGSAGLSAPT